MKRYLVLCLMVLVCGFGGVYAQTSENKDTTNIIAKEANKTNAKKQKLSKEDKKRLKELDAVVKTAKRKLSKEEKARINRLTLLEIDLNDWLKDTQAQWYNVGMIELKFPPSQGQGMNDDPIYGDLWIKQGAKVEVKVVYRGIEYEGQRWNTFTRTGEWYRWRGKDITLIPFYFNLPDELGIDDSPVVPEYKHYNPWKELIELEKKDGKLTSVQTDIIEKNFNKLMKERKKVKSKKVKEVRK